MKLTGTHATNYKADLKSFIISNEKIESKLYLDSENVITIGAGYAIGQEKKPWKANFKKAGIILNEKQKSLLKKYIDIINAEQTKDAKKAKIKEYYTKANAISLSKDQAGSLFVAVRKEYEDIVKNALHSDTYDSLLNTKEMVALVDLAYNGGSGMFGTGLVDALNTNDRAEAWYQIRYRSNGGKTYKNTPTGIARRRVAESNLFDLYPSDANENYYKQVMKMYEKHKNKIYEIEHSNHKGNNKEPMRVAYEEDGLIDTKLAIAKDYLVSNYAQGTTIDGDIIVGQGIGNIPEKYADGLNGNDDFVLQGTTKNDLIFGERGNDTLKGKGGDDVIYGGKGSDTLEGGKGSDHLFGGEGNDTLIGGDDSSTDILLGGIGKDTIKGQKGNDILAGGASFSDLYSEKEADYLLGGTGFDTYYVSKYNKTINNPLNSTKTLKNSFKYKNIFDTINKKEYAKYISKIA